jgi:hypothetical protein
MCGIAGYVANSAESAEKLKKIFALMGVFMESRGHQSWGWTNGTEIDKHKGELQATFDIDKHGGALTAAIHTRWATTGAVIAENSHPWKFEHEGRSIIGMHNGMIYNHKELTKKYEREATAPVDSQHIFLHILEGRDLSELEGYGTIFYWEDDKVWFGRFSGGDLEVAQTEYGVVFCSTRWAIVNAFNMMGESGKIKAWFQIDQQKFYYIDKVEVGVFKTDRELDIDRGINTGTWQSSGTGTAAQQQEEWWKRYSGNTTGTPIGNPNGNLHKDVDRCDWCRVLFHEDDDIYECGDAGVLCEDCADWYYENDKAYKLSDDDFEEEERGDYVESRASLLDPELRMIECGMCTLSIVGDEAVFIHSQTSEYLCKNCHEAEMRVNEPETKEEAGKRGKLLIMSTTNTEIN